MSSLDNFSRRNWLKKASLASLGLVFTAPYSYAKTYLTAKQAKQLILGDSKAKKVDVVLTKAQTKSIKAASKVRVRYPNMTAYKTAQGDWFILDKVIGKHENIDVAVGLNNKGQVTGIEILVYRESYGHQVRGKKWLLQFKGVDKSKHLKLDKQIQNISGATLSCSHITDAINRLTHTWDQVLRYL